MTAPALLAYIAIPLLYCVGMRWLLRHHRHKFLKKTDSRKETRF